MSRTEHKIILSSNNRISGTPSNFTIPVAITQLDNLPKITTVRLEWTSIITSTSVVDMYIATDSFSIPQTYQSNRTNDINVLGVIPWQLTNGTSMVYFATPQHNLRLPVINPESALKSGSINIKIVDRLGNEITTMNQEYSLALFFS